MKMIVWPLCLNLLIMQLIHAQTPRGNITGSVRDGQNKALAGTTVRVQEEQDSTASRAKVAAADGDFSFSDLPAGSYQLTCTHIGFRDFTIRHLLIDAGHETIRLPAIILVSSNVRVLPDIVVAGKKPLVEQKIDRTIVNVDAMISAAGSSALEALAKSPGVYVDQNGNIELNGQGGVLVLIDDKPTYLSAQDLAAYLRSLPAGLVDKIELMGNPPARYDASGSAVINLQLKKNRAGGLNGNLSLADAQGFYNRVNDGLNVNYRKKAFNAFANAGFTHDANYTNDDGNRDVYNPGGALSSLISLHSRYTAYSPGIWNVRTGIDFFASPNTTLGFVLTAGVRPKTDLLEFTGTQYDAAMQPDTITGGYTSGTYLWRSKGANLNFLHKMGNCGQQLSADVDYIQNQSSGSQWSPGYTRDPQGTLLAADTILNQTPSVIDIYAAKTDYTLPLPAKAEFDAGLKTSLVNTDDRNNWFNQAGVLLVPDLANTNHFIYHENINAAYIDAKKEWKRWGIQPGLRVENTNALGHQPGNSVVPDSSFAKSYTNYFPNFFLSYKLDSMGNNTLVLSYSIRVNRPNYQQLDPFLYYKNPYTYSAGDPYLNPAYNHILQLKYAYKQYFGVMVAYFHATHIIYGITQNTNNVFVTRPENFGINNSINFVAYTNVPLSKWWDLNATALVFNLTNKGNASGQVIDDNHTTGEIELSNEFTFSHEWSGELNCAYHGPGYGGQTESASIWTTSAGIQKKILKGNGAIRFNGNDIFHTLKTRQTVVTGGASYTHTSQSDTRLIGLSIIYHFGKAANARKRNDNGSAEEEKGRAN